MEQGDAFLISLENRRKNLQQRLERIQKKEIQIQQNPDAKLQDDEIASLNSKPQVEAQLSETERHLENYLKLQGKAVPQPAKKREDNRSNEILKFFLIGDFLTHSSVQNKYLSENDDGDLEAFLRLYALSKVTPDESFNSFYHKFQETMEFYLSKTEKIAPGTMHTYRNIFEFVHRAFSWGQSQWLPVEEVEQAERVQKLIIQEPPQADEQQPEDVPELSPGEEEGPERFAVKEPISLWADEDSDEEELQEASEKPKPEDDFVEVTSKRSRRPPPSHKNNQSAQNTHTRGKRGDRRSGPRGFRRGRDNQ